MGRDEVPMLFRSRWHLHALATLALIVATPATAADLCLRVTVNDRPAGQETRLRLAAAGQEARSARPDAGTARFAGLADGAWKLTLRHPQMKTFSTTLTLDRATAVLLDCGHAGQWSGCTVESASGDC